MIDINQKANMFLTFALFMTLIFSLIFIAFINFAKWLDKRKEQRKNGKRYN